MTRKYFTKTDLILPVVEMLLLFLKEIALYNIFEQAMLKNDITKNRVGGKGRILAQWEL